MGSKLKSKSPVSSPAPQQAIRKTPSLCQSTHVFRLGLAVVNRQQQQQSALSRRFTFCQNLYGGMKK